MNNRKIVQTLRDAANAIYKEGRLGQANTIFMTETNNALHLLENGAVQINVDEPFDVNGLKSPITFDNTIIETILEDSPTYVSHEFGQGYDNIINLECNPSLQPETKVIIYFNMFQSHLLDSRLVYLKERGINVIGAFSIGCNDIKLSDISLPIISFTDFKTLIHVASLAGFIKKELLASLEEWYQDPKQWSKNYVFRKFNDNIL